MSEQKIYKLRWIEAEEKWNPESVKYIDRMDW